MVRVFGGEGGVGDGGGWELQQRHILLTVDFASVAGVCMLPQKTQFVFVCLASNGCFTLYLVSISLVSACRDSTPDSMAARVVVSSIGGVGYWQHSAL